MPPQRACICKRMIIGICFISVIKPLLDATAQSSVSFFSPPSINTDSQSQPTLSCFFNQVQVHDHSKDRCVRSSVVDKKQSHHPCRVKIKEPNRRSSIPPKGYHQDGYCLRTVCVCVCVVCVVCVVLLSKKVGFVSTTH